MDDDTKKVFEACKKEMLRQDAKIEQLRAALTEARKYVYGMTAIQVEQALATAHR